MAARLVEDTPTSPYAVLGVSRHATAEQIKHAYRHKAKLAHPDAGGSVSAMARVNEAYHTLSDAASRRSYDEFHAPSGGAPSHHRPQAAHPQPSREYTTSQPAHEEYTTHHPRGARPYHTQASEHVTRSRNTWARHSAWELFRVALPAAIGAIVIARFTPSETFSPQVVTILNTLCFMPVYFLILSLIFLTDPPLRLVFADLARRHPTTRHERGGALAIILAFFPLAALWLVFI